MKQLVEAIKEVYQTISPIEDAFDNFKKMEEDDIENHTAKFDEHILLQAFLVLKKGGFHFADNRDVEDFNSLVTLIKKHEEVKDEGKKSKARRKGAKRRVRLHHRPRRPLPV